MVVQDWAAKNGLTLIEFKDEGWSGEKTELRRDFRQACVSVLRLLRRSATAILARPEEEGCLK